YELIGYQATKSLIQQGSNRIAYVGGDMNQFFIADRHNGYKRALESAGIIYDPSLIYNDINFLPSDGYELAQNKIDFSQIDGLVITDELVAEGIRNYMDSRIIKDDYQITFSAYRQVNTQSMTKTSYVNINTHIIGSRAVDILFEDLNPDQASTRFIHEYVDADLHTT